MRVLRADAMGMCFGVRDALEAAAREPDPGSVTIHGELVHNRDVNGALARRGFGVASEPGRGTVPATPAVMITAHGVSHKERHRLVSAGKRVIDTTCPLVMRAHDAALELHRAGRHVIVIGRRGHVEVEGLVGDLDHFDVVEHEGEVASYPYRRLGLVCQTTACAETVHAVRRAVARRNPGADIRFIDTVCRPTKERQAALEQLLRQVDSIVVVGGRNSNNTRRLVERCRRSRVPVHHVEAASELQAAWFRGVATVGLTAGTSTPDSVIDEVDRRLAAIGSKP